MSGVQTGAEIAAVYARRRAAANELYEALEACRLLALHCAELDHPIIAQTDRALAKARGQ